MRVACYLASGIQACSALLSRTTSHLAAKRPIHVRASKNAWDTEAYATNAGFVPELGKAVADLLPAPPASVLDVGCGDGVLSEELIKRGYTVAGIDADSSMIQAALRRGIEARVDDAQTFQVKEQVDCVFSNAALHWMPDTRAVVRSVHDALKSGGYFVGEAGGYGNLDAVRGAIRQILPNETELCPWTFLSAETFRNILEDEGFQVLDAQLFERPVVVSDVAGWVKVFGNVYWDSSAMDEEDALMRIREVAHQSLERTKDGYKLDYVRLRWRAIKKASRVF